VIKNRVIPHRQSAKTKPPADPREEEKKRRRKRIEIVIGVLLGRGVWRDETLGDLRGRKYDRGNSRGHAGRSLRR